MSLIVKIGKTGKRVLKKLLAPAEQHRVSFVRRIERVKTARRMVAMTFDDGPMDLPCSPDLFGGRSLTEVTLDTLAEFGAKGTFDIIGDTSENYPDTVGAPGSAAWGGIRFDHYPDFGKDNRGGAIHNERLLRRILAEGHQLTNHGYRHILFGKKPFVYGKRHFLGSFDAAEADLARLDGFITENYGYAMKLARPPHYVDRVEGSLTAYDVYEALGYQYLAASFDGAGWLPSTLPDAGEAYAAEVKAMVEPLRAALEKNPDALCGQIIFQKDGYNMARRTPVASGLREQLQLLAEYGYRVVTVEELMQESPFADVGRDDPAFAKLAALSEKRAIVYSDNRLRLERTMSWAELAMLLAPRAELLAARRKEPRRTAYACALDWCKKRALLPENARENGPVTALPAAYFEKTSDFTRRAVLLAFREGAER